MNIIFEYLHKIIYNYTWQTITLLIYNNYVFNIPYWHAFLRSIYNTSNTINIEWMQFDILKNVLRRFCFTICLICLVYLLLIYIVLFLFTEMYKYIKRHLKGTNSLFFLDQYIHIFFKIHLTAILHGCSFSCTYVHTYIFFKYCFIFSFKIVK